MIRELLLYVEGQPAGVPVSTVSVPEGTSGAVAGEHIALLIDRGLVEGEVIDVQAPGFVIYRITWEGHDFLEAIHNDKVWKRILGKAAAMGGSMTLEIAKELGKTYLMELSKGTLC